jgi:predicted RNase H-like HicB family nuclease
LLKKDTDMKYFYAVMEQEGDSAYGVTFPDLPGCFSAADRIEDVLPNATEALELWFDDQDEVEPSRPDQVRTIVSEELAAGATLLAVPCIVNDHKVTRRYE